MSDALVFHLVVGNLTVSWGLFVKSRDSKLERWKTLLGNIPRLVRFCALYRIKPHAPPLVHARSIPLSFGLATAPDPHIPRVNTHRLRHGLAGYLILFASHAFSPQRRQGLSVEDRVDYTDNYCRNWTFTSSPDSSDCFVIGFEFAGSPTVFYITKMGESVCSIYHNG
ncbi:hypothetical protein H5410_000556 [Solanum commersonii]|uniref:Uncharacterized protein n=1 Tax=Solanum commersonii TaxID=4109 RepID=A0A9J6AXK4_SOLCO|nr:hypothetical protein H5410_000556 [Solanum commersonii]